MIELEDGGLFFADPSANKGSLPELPYGDMYAVGGTTLPTIYTSDLKDPRIQKYNDSMSLYNAYKFQKDTQLKNLKASLDKSRSDFTSQSDFNFWKNAHLAGFGNIQHSNNKSAWRTEFQRAPSIREDYFPEEKPIVDYFNKIAKGNKNFRVSQHISPDLWHKSINPIGEYYDDIGYSPVYKKPVQPIVYKPEEELPMFTLPEITVSASNKVQPTPVAPTPTPQNVQPTKFGALTPENAHLPVQWYSWHGPDKGILMGNKYYSTEEFDKYIEQNPNYRYAAQANSVGYVYRPGQGIVKYADGGYYDVGGTTPSSKPLSTKEIKDIKDFVARQNAKPKTQDQLAKELANKKPYATLEPKFYNAMHTDTTGPYGRGYTMAERNYFESKNIPTDLWAQEKKKLEDQAILDRRRQVKEQAAKDIKEDTWRNTLATTENLTNAFRLFPDDPNSFIDDYLNPLQMVGSMAGNLGRHFASDAGPIDPLALGIDIAVPLGMGVLNPSVGAGAGEFLTTKTPLKNAYKLNPWAFKADPKAAYRMLGDEGFDDAIQVGYLRAKPSAGKWNTQTGKVEYGTPNYEHPYFSVGKPWDKNLVPGKPYMGYKGPYMAELKNQKLIENDLGYSTGRNNIFRPEEQIFTDNPNLRFYKEDWLRGYKQVQGVPQKTKGIINEIATGNSFFPFAWKSPAVGLSEDASQAMFSKLLNSNKLTDAERALITEYQYNSRPFTGRGVPVNVEKQNALNDIIKKYDLNVNGNALATRRFNPENNSLGAEWQGNRLNLGNRPSSFSVGVGTPGYASGAVDRLVIPERYLKGMGKNFIVNQYTGLSDEALSKLSPEVQDFVKSWLNESQIASERELIGTGLDFKRIGKVKNDIGGYDHIVKPYANGGMTFLENGGEFDFVRNQSPKVPTNFEQRFYHTPYIDNPDGSMSSHKMMSWSDENGEHSAPTIVYQNGKLVELTPEKAIDYAYKTGEYKTFGSLQESIDYGNNGYKYGTPMEIFTPNPEFEPNALYGGRDNQILNNNLTPELWEKRIRNVEKTIGDPSTWTLDSYNKLQNTLNDYKNWRENTPEGRSVIDYHNEPNEYVVPLPEHLKKYTKGGMTFLENGGMFFNFEK